MRIGEYLVSIGVLTDSQVSDVLKLQQGGDARKFGEIAVSLGYMKDDSIKRFTDFMSDSTEVSL